MEKNSMQQFMNSYSVKMVIISGLAILLLIPSFLIREIISERMALNETVKNELYAQWGGKQVVAGPVLNVPFTESVLGDNGATSEERKGVAHFLPETLMVEGDIHPQTRKRGIYTVMVYEAQLRLSGSFLKPEISRLGIQNARYDWDAAYFTLGISDMRGIKNMPVLDVNGHKLPVEPGVADTDLFPSGITVKTGSLDPGQAMDFGMELVLVGSEDLLVEALGKTSEVTLKSDYDQPAFTGSFLPSERQVTADGFTANWRVTHLNRNFPQQWTDQRYQTHEANLGVGLLIPVDHYQKSMRSAKYAILFIALNFIIFIFMEIRSKIRIHPFQYSMVAFALLVFYVLLVSVGEQIGFNLAYLFSALAVTLLISWYSYSILRQIRLTAWVILLQAGLYTFLFTILQLQDYALLAGSVGLFVILAIIMKASQKIRWYPET